MTSDQMITGFNVLPGNPDVVHHVILFRVPPTWSPRPSRRTRTPRDRAGPASATPASARQRAGDRRRARGSAPGRPVASEQVYAQGVRRAARARARGWSCRCTTTCWPAASPTGAPPSCASRPAPTKITPLADAAAARRRSSCPAARSTPTATLCDRAAAVADVKKRFGDGPGSTADLLHFLCGPVKPGPVQIVHRDRSPSPRPSAASPATCTCSASRSRSRSTPGKPDARTLLDIPVWDFDNQGSRPIKPARPEARRHGHGHLPPQPGAARPAAVVRGPARQVRRLGRGHHRRDVPRDPAGHPPLSRRRETARRSHAPLP